MGRWLRPTAANRPTLFTFARWQSQQTTLEIHPLSDHYRRTAAVSIQSRSGGRECLAALAALHREGIVHGDVKPANIMLRRSGHVKLIDMGSAIDYHHPPRDRECTPLYAAPEVLEDRMSLRLATWRVLDMS